MNIFLNEKKVCAAPGISLARFKREHKPGADVLICNGAPVPPREAAKLRLKEGDAVVLIRRGEKPSRSEACALLCARHSAGTIAKFRKTAIGIAGAGGLGSNAAMALARSGIGRLIMADFDVVEPSNLNRQAYNMSQIGQYKVDALKRNIRQVNPYVRVDAVRVKLTSRNIARVFAEADILIEAFDAPISKAMLANVFCRRFPAKPVILASGLADCASSNSVRTGRLGPNVYVVGDMRTGVASGVGLMAPRVGIAACHQANLALRLALGLEN